MYPLEDVNKLGTIMEIEKLVLEATKGNKTALEGVAVAIQDNIYYLALRMLVNPDDAKEATQEILIKIITNLSSFRFESQFETWVYRLAANYLITEKRILNRDPGLTFEMYKLDLESDLQDPGELQNNSEYQVLLNELRISCTMAMLLCLNPQHRMAYVLGDILELDHAEASEVLSISKDNFRKQLSRARAKVVEFTSASCRLVCNHAKCSCETKLTGAVKRKRVNSEHIYFSASTQYTYSEVKESLLETQQGLKSLVLHKSINNYKCPVELSTTIERLVADGIKTRNI